MKSEGGGPQPVLTGPVAGKGRSIAITGKGGTGKTMLATLLIRAVSEGANATLLAIDADSAVSLPYTLGIKVKKTVSEVRREIIEVPEAKKKMADQHITSVMKSILARGKGFDLLVMGRPEEPGCFCAVNDLLRYGIENLAREYGLTIIDGEAGPEQLNRRVLKSIDTLLVVADASARSLETARAIAAVAARDAGKAAGVGLVLNRQGGDAAQATETAKGMGLEVLGCIPEDEDVSRFDREGRPLLDLPGTSAAVAAARRLAEKILGDAF